MLRGLPALLRDPLPQLREVVARHGAVVSLPLWGSRALFVNDPDGVRHVLQVNHRNYTKRTFQYSALSLVTGAGLLTTDGEIWRRHRREVQPAFHRGAVDTVATESVRAADRAGEVLDGAAPGPVDTDALLMHVTLDVVGRALVGADLADNPDRGRSLVGAVESALDYVMIRATRPWLAPPGVPTPLSRRLGRAMEHLDTTVSQLLARHGSRPEPGDVLGLLLAAHGRDTLTLREVRDELVTLVIAGHETVAASLTWTLRLVAEHPAVQRTLHAELDRVLTGADGRPRPPTAGDLADLTFARAIVDEGLRLYPPAWIVSRRAVAEDQVAGVSVPAGSTVMVSPWLQHRRPDIWPDPDVFDPWRWRDAAGARDRGYLPFGAGPRLCIGRDVALAESVLVLAQLLRTRVVSAVGPRPRALAGVTLRPEGGSLLTSTPRG